MVLLLLVGVGAQELAVGARLREAISSTRMPSHEDSPELCMALMEVIQASEAFPRLAGARLAPALGS